jgi:hypothetical protein
MSGSRSPLNGVIALDERSTLQIGIMAERLSGNDTGYGLRHGLPIRCPW